MNKASFSYVHGKPILRDVSVALAPGRVTAIIGPNGAGKSTLLRLLTGLRVPRAGAITIENKPLTELSRHERATRLVYLPQQSSIAFDYTASEVVAMGLYAQGASADRGLVAGALERVGLQDRGDELVRTLSAGQQQRVTLARSLAQLGPAIGKTSCYLLADEPVSAMDPRHALASMDVLRELAVHAIGVVVILHDLSLALRYADDALLLSADGRVHAFGASGEILRSGSLNAVFGLDFEELLDSGGKPAAIVPSRNAATV